MPKRVLAICCSDIHLSLTSPIARSVEEDWLECMGRQLDELKALSEEHDAPIVVAGDLFDRHDPKPELINFALARFPKCYAVPGQHDMIHHRLGDIKKTAYYTLVQAGIVTNLKPGRPVDVGGLTLHGFPWGTKLHPLRTKPHDLVLDIAVVHKYMWKNLDSFYSPDDAHASVVAPNLKGYNIVVIGDNHQPWHGKYNGGTTFWNCGGFYRRRSDEVNHKPSVGFIMSDGTMERYYLDVSKDKFLDQKDIAAVKGLDSEGFLNELASLGDTPVSFREAIIRAMERERVSEGVRNIVTKAMEVQQ